jgi:hypothetical protein
LVYESAELGRPLALLVFLRRSDEDVLQIPVFRVADGPDRASLARRLLWQSVQWAIAQGKTLTLLQDGFVALEMAAALRENGFLPVGTDQWMKIAAVNSLTPVDMRRRLFEIGDLHLYARGACRKLSELLSEVLAGEPATSRTFEVEKALFPCRLEKADLPSFIVPLTAAQAKALAAPAETSGQPGFADCAELPPRENAIFLKGTVSQLTSPARVLWLKGGKTGGILACSTLEDVTVGSPEIVHLKFRHLQDAGLGELRKLATGGARGSRSGGGGGGGEMLAPRVTALRFSLTNYFPQPLERALVDKTLAAFEMRARLNAPARIASRTFDALFMQARGERSSDPATLAAQDDDEDDPAQFKLDL